MKVLHVLSQIEMTGAEAYAVTLSDWLIHNAHCEVTLVSNRLHTPCKAKFIARNIHDSKGWNRIKNIFFLRRYIKTNGIQVVHCHSRAAIRVAYWATRGLRVALISTVHGRQHSSFSKRLFDLYGDRIIGVCHNVLRSLQEDFKMDPRKMICVGNPIQVQTKTFTETLTGKLKIAVIARSSGPKGERTRELIKKSFPHLLSRFPELEIDIIGGLAESIDEETNQSLYEIESRFPNRLHILGYMTNLSQRFSEYRLIIGSGRVPMEALAHGIPCYALGEFSAEGLITPDTYDRCKESNFGDIGVGRNSHSQVDYQKITTELIQTLASPPLEVENRKRLHHFIEEDFSAEIISQRVLELYRSTYFRKHHPQHIPILMYHKVPETEIASKHRIFVTKDTFEKHLQYFKKKNFTTLSFQELEDFRNLKRPLSDFPKKPLILTFDDGYRDNLDNAGPLLKKYGMKATIFLLANPEVRHNHWDSDSGDPIHEIMSLEEKKRLKEFNFEVGSHGFEHEKITSMTPEQALQELRGSKEVLEKSLHTKINVFAFTYGVTAPWAARLAQKAGYTFAVNTDTGGLHLEENPYAIFRTPIFPEDKIAQLRKKTSSWYRQYFFLKRGK